MSITYILPMLPRLGALLLLFGIGVGIYGAYGKPLSLTFLGSGFLIGFGSIFFILGSEALIEIGLYSDLGYECLIGGLALILLGIYLFIKRLKKRLKENADKLVNDENNKKISFYEECISNGVEDCTKEKDIQKATLIANRLKIPFTNISDLFNEGKALFEQREYDKLDAEFKEVKEKEQQEKQKLERFATYSNREKRIEMLKVEMNIAEYEAKRLARGANAVYTLSQQKEHDWALMGGIANGIAGPAAGVATAANIQAKNAQIRAQNKANLNAVAPIITTAYSNSASATRQAESLKEEIEKTKIKLVADYSPADCFEKIEFMDTNVEVTETGTCIVTTTAFLKEPLTIFEDVKGTIDGTIIANIYDGDTLIGDAQLVLPKYGIWGEDSVDLVGMSLFTGDIKNAENYEVKFDATNLWAMEI